MTNPSRRQWLQATASAVISAATVTGSTTRADFAPVRSLPVIANRTRSNPSEFKHRAIADYVENMRGFGGSLARHGCELVDRSQRDNSHWDFDIVIIGSGYGASICAARLSIAKRPQTRLAVLERGCEWIPGTFGDTLHQITRESRYKLLGPRKNSIDNPVGLFNTMQNDEVTVLSGSGLGGSSLINANVAIRPDRDCFSQSCWPEALRDRSMLDPYFHRAACELGVTSEQPDASPKSHAQRRAAEHLVPCGASFENADLTITRGHTSDGAILNRQGMRQRGCISCGDCTAGCNVGAKNTLAMNYLPLARQHGAELYTHTEVIRIEKLDMGYRVHFKNYQLDRNGEYQARCGTITTRMVIIGAGSIGSNEIMLRSRGCGMDFSDRVGYQWTTNGDALGFVRQSKYLTNTAAVGAYAGDSCDVGPTIQTNLTYPNRPELSQRILIQDGSVSRAYANILGLLMRDMDFDQTLPMLGMGHDGANGRVVLRSDAGDGHALGEVKWPGLVNSPYRALIRREFARVAAAHSGTYKYLKIFGDNLITVHPLGGCAMADDPLCGVVDHLGRVFDGRQGGMIDTNNMHTAAVHPGLYIADGSIIPTSIGCNPLLTISALAERIADGILVDPAHSDLFRSAS